VAGETARADLATKEGTRLNADGTNLVNVLFTLFNHHEVVYARLLHHLKQEFPHVDKLKFPPGPVAGHMQLRWRDHRFPRLDFDAEQMSTGMVHFLCLLTALYQPDPVELLAFDEPDVHLHPSAIARFVTVAEEVSHKRAVLVATHSDRLLDALSDASGVHTCTPTADGTRIEPVNPDALAAFLEDYTLSDLRRQGLLDASNEDEPA